MKEKRLNDNWEKEYKLICRNSIYFIEMYWNKLHPDEAVELSDEEKQKFYDKYKGVPLLDDSNIREYFAKREEIRAKGIKDWEAFL